MSYHRSSDAGKRETYTRKRAQTSRSPSERSPSNGFSNAPSRNALNAESDNPGDFNKFELGIATQKNLIARGITALFPVQYMTYNRIFKREDLMVRDLTGSGKTLGFCLPMLEMFRKERLFGGGKPLAMILAPTRELAL